MSATNVLCLMNMVTADDLVDDEEYDGNIYWYLFLVAFIKMILETTARNRNSNSLLVKTVDEEVAHLTFFPHIFSVQVKSGACYIKGQWGRVQNKINVTLNLNL